MSVAGAGAILTQTTKRCEMTDADAFRASLERLGLSQTAFAKLTGTGRRTVVRWATEGCLSGPAAVLIRIWEQQRLYGEDEIREWSGE